MAVEGVNNNSNNAGLYALGAGIIGGGAGAVTGYATKSILKDGNYTDEFIKGAMKSDTAQAMIELCKVDEKSNTYLSDCINVVKKYAKVFGIDPKEVTKSDVEIAQMFGGNESVREIFANGKANIAMETGEILTTGKDSNIETILKKHLQNDLDEVFDRAKNEFKSGIDENNITLKTAKKVQRNIKLKAAGIYGAIVASVLSLGTYLFCMNKK